MTNVLGYQTFMAAGGDVGAGVTISLANGYPDQAQASPDPRTT